MAAYSSYLTTRFSTDWAWHGRHVLLGAEALNELLVGRLVAGLREEDDLRLAGVDVLRDLVQAADRAVDHEGVLQHLLHGTHEVGDLPAQRNGSWGKGMGSGQSLGPR